MRLEVEADRSIYYEHHKSSGRAVLLIHGTWVNSRCWNTTLSALTAAEYEVITLGLRGHGRSDADFDDWPVAALANDVVALVNHLKLTDVVLNGWSLGGAVAVAAAEQLGDVAIGVILTAAATPRYTTAPDWPYGTTEEAIEALLAGLVADRAFDLPSYRIGSPNSRSVPT